MVVCYANGERLPYYGCNLSGQKGCWVLAVFSLKSLFKHPLVPFFFRERIIASTLKKEREGREIISIVFCCVPKMRSNKLDVV